MHLIQCSSAVKRHNEHSNSCKRMHLYLSFTQSFRDLLYYHRGGGHGSIHIVLEKQLRILIQIYRHQKEPLGLVVLLNHTPSDILPPTTYSNNTIPCNPSPVVPLPGDEAFKCMNLQEPFLLKLLQYAMYIINL